MKRAALLILALVAVPALALEPMTHEDVWLMKRVGTPVLSPDGSLAVVSVTEPAYDNGEKESDLWIIATDGVAPPQRLTSSSGGGEAASTGDPTAAGSPLSPREIRTKKTRSTS